MTNNSPCFDCAARSPDCHSTCNNYISWKEQKENEQIRKQRYNDYLFQVKHIERSVKSER